VLYKEALYYQKDTLIYHNDNAIKIIDKDTFSEFYLSSEGKLIVQSYFGNFEYDNVEFKGYYNYLNSEGVTYLNTSDNLMYEISNDTINRLNLNCHFYLMVDRAVFINGNTIFAYTFPECNSLWQLDLTNLGKYEDRDGNLQHHEVDKFIGTWKDSVLVACSGQLILDINLQTGSINRKWQELEGFGTNAFHGRLQNKIPSTNGFQLDLTKRKLYHLAGEYLVTIELESSKVSYTSLKQTMDDYVLSNFRWSTGYAENETHIFSIAEMDRYKLGLDFIPQCLVALNKSTLQVDWLYRFEGDWIKTDIPQVSQDKLYQLSANKILYIFQKEHC